MQTKKYIYIYILIITSYIYHKGRTFTTDPVKKTMGLKQTFKQLYCSPFPSFFPFSVFQSGFPFTPDLPTQSSAEPSQAPPSAAGVRPSGRRSRCPRWRRGRRGGGEGWWLVGLGLVVWLVGGFGLVGGLG